MIKIATEETVRASRISSEEIRMLMGTWIDERTDRRTFDRGENLIGVNRRETNRRKSDEITQ